MIKFNAVQWARRKMRGLAFGWHGKSYVYLPDGEEIRFTPTIEMMGWHFSIGPSWGNWWPGSGSAILTDNTGKVYPLYGFVTKDGKEPASRPQGHWDGRERVGLPVGMPMKLTLVAKRPGRKVKVTYAGDSLSMNP